MTTVSVVFIRTRKREHWLVHEIYPISYWSFKQAVIFLFTHCEYWQWAVPISTAFSLVVVDDNGSLCIICILFIVYLLLFVLLSILTTMCKPNYLLSRVSLCLTVLKHPSWCKVNIAASSKLSGVAFWPLKDPTCCTLRWEKPRLGLCLGGWILYSFPQLLFTVL